MEHRATIGLLDDTGQPFGAHIDSALRIMERIRAVVEAVTAASGSTVTASVGLALSAGGTPDIDDLVDTADRALLSVKRSGKNQLLLGETV